MHDSEQHMTCPGKQMLQTTRALTEKTSASLEMMPCVCESTGQAGVRTTSWVMHSDQHPQ
jgi:hypothetical protein